MAKSKQQLSNSKPIHPLSRKAKQLSRKVTRDAKMIKRRGFSNMRLQLLGEKLMWFKENLNETSTFYTSEEINTLIERYIDRNLEESKQISLKNNIGHRKYRQHASREDLIRICRENEMKEFTASGFETIDLTDKENLSCFKKWNGELKLLSNIRLKKFIKSTKTIDVDVNNSDKLNPQESSKDDISMECS